MLSVYSLYTVSRISWHEIQNCSVLASSMPQLKPPQDKIPHTPPKMTRVANMNRPLGRQSTVQRRTKKFVREELARPGSLMTPPEPETNWRLDDLIYMARVSRTIPDTTYTANKIAPATKRPSATSSNKSPKCDTPDTVESRMQRMPPIADSIASTGNSSGSIFSPQFNCTAAQRSAEASSSML